MTRIYRRARKRVTPVQAAAVALPMEEIPEIPDPEAYEIEHDEALLIEVDDHVVDIELVPVIELIDDTDEEDPEEEPLEPEPVAPPPVAVDGEGERSEEDQVVPHSPSLQPLSPISTEDDSESVTDSESDTDSNESEYDSAPAVDPIVPPPPLDLTPVSGAEHAYVVQFMTRDLLSAQARLNEARRALVEEREARLRVRARMRTTMVRRTGSRLAEIKRSTRARVIGLGVRGHGVVQAGDARRVVHCAFARVRALLRRQAAL